MKLLKRLRNLWRLSEWVSVEEGKLNIGKEGKEQLSIVEQPKMAQIIKMNNPAKDFIKEENV